MNEQSTTEKTSSPPSMGFNILIVDNDPAQLETLFRGLFLNGLKCICISTIFDAMDFLSRPDREEIHLLITDITTPNDQVFAMIRHARALHPGMPILAICGLLTSIEAGDAKRDGIAILRRPFNPKTLSNAVLKTLSHNEVSHFGTSQ